MYRLLIATIVVAFTAVGCGSNADEEALLGDWKRVDKFQYLVVSKLSSGYKIERFDGFAERIRTYTATIIDGNIVFDRTGTVYPYDAETGVLLVSGNKDYMKIDGDAKALAAERRANR